MYQITRKNKIKETLQLCHANGDVACEIDVDLNVDEIAGRVNKAREALAMAQNALREDQGSADLLDAYGNAVLALFQVLFTEEGARKIVEFYEGNYSEMLLDVFPFINNEIMPKIQAASEDRKAKLLEAARMANQSSKANRRRK